jgi:hypothetical protein
MSFRQVGITFVEERDSGRGRVGPDDPADRVPGMLAAVLPSRGGRPYDAGSLSFPRTLLREAGAPGSDPIDLLQACDAREA